MMMMAHPKLAGSLSQFVWIKPLQAALREPVTVQIRRKRVEGAPKRTEWGLPTWTTRTTAFMTGRRGRPPLMTLTVTDLI